jgi:polysaccharide export outer membrane protein
MRFLGSLVVLSLFPTLLPAQRSQVIPQGAATTAAPQGALEAELRTRLESSGLTADQVRSRLRAAGYPESLLDGVLGGRGGMGRAAGETARPAADREAMLDAVRALGVVDAEDLPLLRGLGTRRDSVPAGSPDTTVAPADSGLTLFGVSLFRNGTSLFQPNSDGPVDAGYRLGPGDRLVLILTGGVEVAHTLDVTREGFVVIPQVGQLPVATLTLGETERLLLSRLARVYQGVGTTATATTRASLSVARLRSNQVFVTGDVAAPGSYRISSAGTMLSALYAAGGPADNGSLRRVELRRNGQTVGTLDVYDYLLHGDASRDLRLQQGDIVHVPVHGPRVRLAGAVNRPATYEVREGESLAELVRAAGGLRATAAGGRLFVERVVPLGARRAGRDRTAAEVPLDPDGAVPAFPLADGDVVRVPTVADRVRGRVVIRGHVWHPGPQGFAPGLTLTEALRRAGGVQPDGYLPVVHVSRLRADSTRMQLRSALVDTTGDTRTPFALAEDDEVTVYSRSSFRPERSVAIVGAVRNGGRFPWREGMTLRDLVIMAQGLDDGADLREAEVARLPDPGRPDVSALTIRVPLDSSFRLEDGGAAQGTDLVLSPYDNVLIRRDPGYRALRAVTVTGEVTYPGTYVLRGRQDRLAELVARVGGLSAQADPRGAYFSRKGQAERRAAFADVATGGAPRDSAAVRDAARQLEGRYRVGIDLERALRQPTSLHDLLLTDGDSLHVPERQQVVQVVGAVNYPAAQAYTGRRSLGYYLRSAGGATDRARARAAYVIQPNGRVESRRTILGLVTFDPTPLPGALVVVPEKTPSTGSDRFLSSVAVVAQLVTSLAAVVALTR